MILSSRQMIALLLPFGLVACATPDVSGYPSLARRPVEEQQAVVQPSQTSPAPPQLATATVTQAIAGLISDANGGESAFRRELASSRGQVTSGRGAGAGTEAWAVGQTALSRIEVSRGPTTFALAELDRLALEALDKGDAASAQALGDAQTRVQALVNEQNRILQSLGVGG